MENTNIRAFIALPLSNKCRDKISSFIFESKKLIPFKVKWGDTSQLHLTLKFFGVFNYHDINNLNKKLLEAQRIHTPFEIIFQRVGVFPNLKKPQILWVGINPSSQLKILFNDVENVAQIVGYAKDQRQYFPHITIGRIKYALNDQEIFVLGKYLNLMNGRLISKARIERITFIKSQLTVNGPIYSELFSIDL